MPRADPLYGVCSWGTPHNTIFDDIEQTARTGGAGVGLWEAKIGPGDDERVAEALAAHGLRASLVVPRLHTFLFGPISPPDAPKDPKERTRRICASIERLAAFEPAAIIVGPGTSGDPARPNGPVELVADCLREVADVAASLGQTIAFEALATRYGAPLGRLNEIVPFLEELGQENVGVMFDVWHSWEEPHLYEHIAQYGYRISGVHVNDAPLVERSLFDRVLPGEGRARCPEILAALIEAGYDGWYESEIFSDDGTFGNDFPDSLWKLPHEELLRRTKAAFDSCWAEALAIVANRGRSSAAAAADV